MKKIVKYIMAIAVASSAMFYSCETIELELVDNPNGLSEDQADPNLLLNSVQLGYLSNMSYFNGRASSLTRLNVFFNRDYFAGVTPVSVNAVWTRTYSTTGTRGMIPNTFAIEALNTAAGDGSLNYAEGVAKTLLAHNMMLLVDYIGDVPYAEVNNPDEFPAPNVDSGASVYAAALGLLDEAEALLNGIPSGDDLFDIGTGSGWLSVINTIRMKAALTTGDTATFTSLESGGNFVGGPTGIADFRYQYITNDVNPDGRHPDYINDYTPSGANIYQSNWLMNQMMTNNDPRIRYYFFRQTDCTPGASCNPAGDGQTLSCSLQAPPVHYVNAGFGDIACFLENGYWGRSHGNDEGTPPDNFFRTASGVYPGGGYVDGDNFRNGTIELNSDTGSFEFVLDALDDQVGLGVAGEGAGIEPFILGSFVDFMRAEVALSNGATATAADHIRNGLDKSISLVQSFQSLDSNFSPGTLLDGTVFNAATGEITTSEATGDLFPTSADNQTFIDGIVADFNAAAPGADQWNILAEQLWVTQYGAGAETYNFYRRTGFPTTLPPNLEPNPGPFVRSIPYPANEVIANPNISQKSNQSVQVFWDTNPPSAVSGGFPASN
ncbi:SusD/RagB family nutrient-binding outer membrane lipoprotein [Dokdonia sp.]|uniref:SusD/RagB family nutrient-binding outer membrane lipoprotein n=1 Tax=Dokdonia sp. TaxID=2024995 RepID=UPI003266FB18